MSRFGKYETKGHSLFARTRIETSLLFLRSGFATCDGETSERYFGWRGEPPSSAAAQENCTPCGSRNSSMSATLWPKVRLQCGGRRNQARPAPPHEGFRGSEAGRHSTDWVSRGVVDGYAAAGSARRAITGHSHVAHPAARIGSRRRLRASGSISPCGVQDEDVLRAKPAAALPR